jgi:hypothetical protein
MGSPVTLANGRVVEVTSSNWQALALEDNTAWVQRFGSDSREEAGRLTAFRQLGSDPGVKEITEATASVARSAAAVIGNPFVRLSDAATGAVGASGAKVWTDASNFTIAKWRELRGTIAQAPAAAGQAFAELGTTARIVAISAAVAAVAIGGAYVVGKFK